MRSRTAGSRAFTLMEVLVVIAILTVLAALIYPVGARAKRQAQRTGAMANLKQHYYALAMYRTDYGGDGVYGKASEMGLPVPKSVYGDPSFFLDGLGERSFLSTCPTHPDVPGDSRPHGRNFDYYPSNDPSNSWARLTFEHVDATVLLGDFNCNDRSTKLGSMKAQKFGIGVNLAGSAFVRWSTHGDGDMFWYD